MLFVIKIATNIITDEIFENKNLIMYKYYIIVSKNV